MGNQGFKKQRDLKLHSLKYHPRPKAPELILDLPSLTPDLPSLTPDLLSRKLERLTIEYAPDVERSFSVELLHQFRMASICSYAAISPDERYFAVAANKVIQVFNFGSGEVVMSFDAAKQATDRALIRHALFTPDSNFLIGAINNNVMVCYHAST